MNQDSSKVELYDMYRIGDAVECADKDDISFTFGIVVSEPSDWGPVGGDGKRIAVLWQDECHDFYDRPHAMHPYQVKRAILTFKSVA